MDENQQNPLHYAVRSKKSSRESLLAALTLSRGNFCSQHFKKHCLYEVSTGSALAFSEPETQTFHDQMPSHMEDFFVRNLKLPFDDKKIELDFEVVIPWVLKNIFKRCRGRVEVLESKVEQLAENSSIPNILLPLQLRFLLYELSIVVTDGIIYELCRRYSPDFKSLTAKQEEYFKHVKAKKNGKGCSRSVSSSESKSETKDERDSDRRRDNKSGVDSDEDDGGYKADGVRASRGIELCEPRERDEDFGLDVELFLKDFRSGDGFKSVELTSSAPTRTREGVNISKSTLTSWSRDLATLKGMARNRLCIVNQTDIDGRTPLFYAAALGNCEAVKLLISHGALIVAANNGETPITVAANGIIRADLERRFVSELTSRRLNNSSADFLGTTAETTEVNYCEEGKDGQPEMTAAGSLHLD